MAENDNLVVTAEKRLKAQETSGSDHPDTYQGASPIKVNKLGHFVYEVTDMERTVRFWTDVMGFEETFILGPGGGRVRPLAALGA